LGSGLFAWSLKNRQAVIVGVEIRYFLGFFLWEFGLQNGGLGAAFNRYIQ
jgi:hypothetical protein